ncbi:MAG: phage holin family protein [Gemmatimonadales bacterium]|nr:phage holin family protein [Gemmatimonadales bacterium]MDQ3426776.1 phage holin family protein [Gemmatimonadota bacterium]
MSAVSLVLHWLVNAAALWVATRLIPGLSFDGGLVQLLLVAAVFGIVNSLLRPILTVLTCPLIVITLGLFTLVINAVMLMLTGWLSVRWNLGFAVSGFWPAFWGGLVVGLVSLVLSMVGGRGEKGNVG